MFALLLVKIFEGVLAGENLQDGMRVFMSVHDQYSSSWHSEQCSVSRLTIGGLSRLGAVLS